MLTDLFERFLLLKLLIPIIVSLDIQTNSAFILAVGCKTLKI